MAATQPADIERLGIVVMVGVGARVPTDLAGLAKKLPGFDRPRDGASGGLARSVARPHAVMTARIH
jgi:hypothetical protein